MSIELDKLTRYSLCCLIEALHDDVDDGVPFAKQLLERCQQELRRQNMLADNRYALAAAQACNPDGSWKPGHEPHSSVQSLDEGSDQERPSL